jgi:hypothetical protein
MKAKRDLSFPLMDASSSVFPTIRINGNTIYLAYHLPRCEDSAVVSFHDVMEWSYGYPNDEGLAEHRLWGSGLKHYEFHFEHDESDNPTSKWIATFHDGTFEIEAKTSKVEVKHAKNSNPSEALDSHLGSGENIILDRSDYHKALENSHQDPKLWERIKNFFLTNINLRK